MPEKKIINNLLRVGIDLDGVLIDHSSNKLKVAERQGYVLESWQANSNIMHDIIPPEEYAALREEVYTQMTVDAPPIIGALEAIAELDCEAYIVSARRPKSIRFAQEWLLKHNVFETIPAERIFFCGSKNDKMEICDRLGIKILIDDQLGVLKLLSPKVKRVLFDIDGISGNLDIQEGMYVANGWDQVRKLVN